MRHDLLVMSDWFRQKKGFSIERLAALVSVAEHGGIMNAAGGEPNRQSLLSRQIKELESFFDFPLLDRRSVPHQLTEAGRQIAQHTGQFLSSIERSIEQHSNERPLVRMAAGESVIQWLLIPALAKKLQQKKAPRIQFLNRSSRKTIDQIVSGAVDIGIVKESDVRSHLAFRKLASYNYGVIVNPKLLSIRKKPTWLSLAGVPLVIQENRGALRMQIDRLNAEVGAGPEIIAECTSFPQVLDLVLNSACVGILPRHAKKQVEAKGCQWLELNEFQSDPISLGVVWDESRVKNQPAMEIVLRWLIS